MGSPCPILGSFWGFLSLVGDFWVTTGFLGSLLGLLSPILGSFGVTSGAFGVTFGVIWDLLGSLWGFSGPFGDRWVTIGFLGSVLGGFEVHFRAPSSHWGLCNGAMWGDPLNPHFFRPPHSRTRGPPWRARKGAFGSWKGSPPGGAALWGSPRPSPPRPYMRGGSMG